MAFLSFIQVVHYLMCSLEAQPLYINIYVKTKIIELPKCE